MAIPFYNPADEAIYQGGEHFIPQERYRLNYTPSTALASTIGGTGGVTRTQAAIPYIWPPQGGGGGGGGGGPDDDDATGYSSLGLSPGALGGKLPGIGNWAKRTVGKLGDIYSNLPTPGNIIKKGIETYKDWKEEKEAEKARISTITRKRAIDKLKEKYDEDPDSIGIPKGGGADVGNGNQGGNPGGQTQGQRDTAAAQKDDPGLGGHKKGGRIGFKDGLSAYQLFKLKELGYPGAGSNPGSYGGLAVLRDILKLHKYKDGGRIGYWNGEFVEDVNVEGPGFDVNENLMASDDNNTRILENLFEKYLELGFSPQDAEIKAMEEFELMSQGPEQDQGIASLV